MPVRGQADFHTERRLNKVPGSNGTSIFNVRFRRSSGHGLAQCICLLETQSGLGSVFPCAVAASLHLASLKVVNFEQTRMPDRLRLSTGRSSSPSSVGRLRMPADIVGWCLTKHYVWVCVSVLSPARNCGAFFSCAWGEAAMGKFVH
jgi:hypothetical protein